MAIPVKSIAKTPSYGSIPPPEKPLRVIALIATRFLWLHGVCIEQQLIRKHSPTSLTASETECSPSKSDFIPQMLRFETLCLHFSNPEATSMFYTVCAANTLQNFLLL